jgi:hypothetical protein
LTYVSSPDDLVLHGPRVLGFASAARVSSRYGLPQELVEELLQDYEAAGWTRRTGFAGSDGWYLSDEGKAENERRLAAELDAADARGEVTRAHQAFLPLNARLGAACTSWQIRPTPTDPLALNDHTDWRWDERVLRTLRTLNQQLDQLCAPLARSLPRFDGYAARFSAALAHVDAGDRRWVDAPDVDSCHTVWIQRHEDFLATLGIPRGSDG